MIVLDTTILSVALRRRPAARVPEVVERFRQLLATKRMLIPGIVLQEVLSGIHDDDGRARLQQRLAAFPRLFATEADHLRAADIVTRCQRAGIAAGAMDALIAAQAIGQGAELLALDGDYAHMLPYCPGLELVGGV